jgi:superfamily II DNA or RNA helicase
VLHRRQHADYTRGETPRRKFDDPRGVADYNFAVQLRITPTFTEISGRIALAAMQCLHETLRYRPPNYFHDPRFQWHKWDGWESIWSPKHLRFPAGLTDRVLEALHDAGIAVEVTDEGLTGPPATPRTALPDGTTLFPDQAEALHAALAQQRGLMELATNFGKTELIAALCASYATVPILVITPQRTLVTQTVTRLRTMLREPVAVFHGGRGATRVVVATIQGLASAYRRDPDTMRAYLQRFAGLLADEAHTITVVQWFAILGACPAPIRLGMSGSLEEARVPMLSEAYFGPVFHQVIETQLIQAGRSAQAQVVMPYVASAIPESPDFDSQYVPKIVRNEARNATLVEMLARGVQLGWPGLGLFFRHEHGEALQTLLAARGIPAGLAHGGVHPMQAERAVRDFAEGRAQILLAGHAYAAGIDLPRARLLVNAGAWKSPLVTRQKVGRILRRKLEGANTAVVADPYDLGNVILKRHSENRRKLYAKRLGVEPHVGPLDAAWGMIVDQAAVN